MDSTQDKNTPRTKETIVSRSMEKLETLSDFIPFSKLGDSSHFANNDNCENDTETEANSFIILGKDSLDAIQASSLASYVDIQQKSMSVDYNTMVSSLATNEIHQKLAELLQENTKLKETLKQNNLAMKKQLTVMVSWQDMVMKLHENHMEKFKETTNLIGDLKKENLELKTKLAMQQTEDTEYNFEATDTISNIDNSNNFTCKAMPQELEASGSSILEKEEYILPNDQKPELAMPQIEIRETSLEATNMYYDSNNIFTYETLPQEETSASFVPEKKDFILSNKQHICQCSCDNLKKKIDYHKDICHFQKEDNAKQNVIKKCNVIREKLLFENYKRQMPCEYNVNYEDLFAKFEESSPAVDQIKKLIYSIDEMNSVHWNDVDYEKNRMRYNSLISELVKNSIEMINKCKILTYCLNNMMTIFATVEETINEGTSKANWDIMKLEKEFVTYSTLMAIYNRLNTDNDTNQLNLTFSDALKNVLEHIRDVFADYWENLNLTYLIMDETLKVTDAHNNDFHDNSQEQSEVQEKLKVLTIQQSKIQKQEKELEKRAHELNLQDQLLSTEKRRMHEVDLLREQLIRRKNLYDGKVRALLNEKLLLMRDQKIDPADLLKKFRQKNAEYEKLQNELDQTISEINVYKSQISVYEEDFKQERNLKESLLEEKNKLDVELQKQINYNKQLTNNLPSTRFRPVSECTSRSNNEVMPPCPKCERTFATLQSLTEHIEQCLNLS